LRFTCVSVSRRGTGNPRGSCLAGTVPLLVSNQVIAGGNRGGGSSSFVVNISVSFVDSWRFAASQSCSLSLTYTLDYDLPANF
jgi:hypothetical protein